MPTSPEPDQLVDRLCAGDRRALARALTIVEEDRDGASEVLSAAFAASLGAPIVGITGAPGAGKSTLTDQVVRRLRAGGTTVGVLAVDPSSPFTGGAILGDRVRMQDHAEDSGVFIRSVSNRGHLGGLARSVGRMLTIFDASGLDELLVETVGVGQSEVEIVDQADTTVVILTPGWGDAVQANKAGLLEAGDIFVVNKADRAGTDAAIRDLHQMLDLGGERLWRPPVVTTVATTGEGVDQVLTTIADHRQHLASSGEADERRRRRRRRQMESALHEALLRGLQSDSETDGLLARVERGEIDPWTAAEQALSTEY